MPDRRKFLTAGLGFTAASVVATGANAQQSSQPGGTKAEQEIVPKKKGRWMSERNVDTQASLNGDSPGESAWFHPV
jgi:hypothetical protein